MSQYFFIFILIIAEGLKLPLSILVIILKNFNISLRKRVEFERKNFSEEHCRSFKKDNIVADYCFEVSSEGELEQIRPILEFFLKNNNYIELIFASPSVEVKCLKLANEYKDTLRVLRMPLINFQSASGWISAPKIIFCRYDFFPELLLLKLFGKKLILLSAASKNPTWFKREAFKFFNLIVAANTREFNYFKENYPSIKLFDFDFRIPRIIERKTHANSVLEKVTELKSYLSFLKDRPADTKLILGSAWVSDLVIFNNAENLKWTKKLKEGSLHLLIVPHNLNSDSILKLQASLKSIFPTIPIYEISKAKGFFNSDILQTNPGIVILNMSGILCELFSHFSFAYIGGGYERSIHSVLEPFFSGLQVAIGPKIHRSTEYDYVEEILPREIHLLNNPESFYHLFINNVKIDLNIEIRDQLARGAKAHMDAIINEIKLC